MQVTAERGTKTRVRNKAKWKLVKERPSRLQSAPRDPQDGDSDSDDDWSSGLISHQEEVQNNQRRMRKGLMEEMRRLSSQNQLRVTAILPQEPGTS